MATYAQVILPLPVEGSFTYLVPPSLKDKVKCGGRVTVPFGPKKFYTGIVESVTPIPPEEKVFALKDIFDVPPHSEVLRYPQLKFWEWMAEYYLCTKGEVMRAALPSMLKLESETVVELAFPEILAEIDPESLDSVANSVIDLLSRGKRSVRDLEKAVGEPGVLKTVEKLMASGTVNVYERVRERFKAKTVSYLIPLFNLLDAAEVETAFKSLRTQKQVSALMALVGLWRKNGIDNPAVEKSKAMESADVLPGTLKSLKEKGLLEEVKKEIFPFGFSGGVLKPLPDLSEAQIKALDAIRAEFTSHKITLLHGVTSSGKTEIYIHLISEILKRREQVLMLVPEIALTTQLTARMQSVFGDRVVVSHSKFSDRDRASVWVNMLSSNEPMVILGARSAVFLPFSKLGLVIVDEEHESSYKQTDPAPRYNGRDAAIMLAMMHGAKVLLGSATPSVETYYKAKQGKFGLVTLSERYGGVSLPEMELVDMGKERQRNRVAGLFSNSLICAVNDTVMAGKQSILFLNRRGFAPIASCTRCGYVAKCDFCDVPLTFHKRNMALVCHYCGASYPIPKLCPQCNEPSVRITGYGTERLEEDLERAFPGQKIMRMDLDTTRNKDSYAKLIDDFSEGRASILVGTQMVTKGLDFKNVETVGVLSADAAINYPDFRSAERAFNMISQVAGRAGRRDNVGKVFIQAYNTAHRVINFVKNHDFIGFYGYEIGERKKYAYPPFSRVINIYLKHRNELTLEKIAEIYGKRMRELFGNRVSGPMEPRVGKVQNFHIRCVMLKIETGASMAKVKQVLRQLYIEMHNLLPEKGLLLYYDVDPS